MEGRGGGRCGRGQEINIPVGEEGEGAHPNGDAQLSDDIGKGEQPHNHERHKLHIEAPPAHQRMQGRPAVFFTPEKESKKERKSEQSREQMHLFLGGAWWRWRWLRVWLLACSWSGRRGWESSSLIVPGGQPGQIFYCKYFLSFRSWLSG